MLEIAEFTQAASRSPRAGRTTATHDGCRKTALVPKSVSAVRDERGFTLIDMLFVVAMIGLLCTLALPALTRARSSAHASSALGTLRVINSAQLSFAIGCGAGFFAPDLPALGLVPAGSTEGFLSSDMTNAITVVKSGYSFTIGGTPLAGAPASCNGLPAGRTATGYVAIADSLDALALPRFFGTNGDGVIYEHTATLNGVMPEAGLPAAGSPVNR